MVVTLVVPEKTYSKAGKLDPAHPRRLLEAAIEIGLEILTEREKTDPYQED